jgi:hypothetical protein
MFAQLLRTSLMHHLVRVVCCALVATPLLSGAQFVDSGLERAQFYAGTCLSIDPQCSVNDSGVNLGESPSHVLNLALHLSGLLPMHSAVEPSSAHAPQVAKVALLPQWLFASRIDHPPKA